MKKAKVSKYGQWKYPGQDTIIPNANGSITMKGVPYPVLGIDDRGNRKMMMPGAEYQFPGNSVYEIPMMAAGGIVNRCPPGKIPDGRGNCIDDPFKINLATAADSSEVANSSAQVSNYFLQNGYKLKSSRPATDQIFSDLAKKRNAYNAVGPEWTPRRDTRTKETVPYNTYTNYNKKNPKFEQRELSIGVINTEAPRPKYDTRIVPQTIETYDGEDKTSVHYEDVAQVPTYNVLATTPWKDLTIEQQIERLETFGGSGTVYKTEEDIKKGIEDLKKQQATSKVPVNTQSGPREVYTLHQTGNGGGAAYLYKTVWDENGNVDHSKSGNIGVVLTQDYLDLDQQKAFDSPTGGHARVDFNPNVRLWHDLREPLDIIEEQRGTRQKALEMHKRNVDEVNAEKAAYEQYQQQQKDKEKARLKKAQEEIEAEKKAGGYAYGGVIDPDKPKVEFASKTKSSDENYLYKQTYYQDGTSENKNRRTLKGFITGAPKPGEAGGPPKLANGGAKMVKIKSLPKAQDLGELTPEQRKVYDDRYIYNREYGFDPNDSHKTALRDAQLSGNPDPIYNFQTFLPDPKVIVPAGKRFPLEHIDWNGYDSFQENYMSDPNYVSRYNKRTPEQQQEMKNQINETENAQTYYNNVNAVKAWERDWYTKRAELPWFTDLANKRLNLSRDINMQPYGNEQEYKLRFPGSGGVFTTNGNYIGLPPDAWSNKNTMVHERSHWFDFNAPQNDDMYNGSYFRSYLKPGSIPQPVYNEEDDALYDIIPAEYKFPSGVVDPLRLGENDTNTYNSETEKIEANMPKSSDDIRANTVKIPFKGKANVAGHNNIEYYHNPTEVRARLNEWRFQHNIDPTKYYSNEELQQIIDKDIENNQPGSFDLYKVIQGRGDLLKKLHDTYVSTGDKEDPDEMPKAQITGELSKEKQEALDREFRRQQATAWDPNGLNGAQEVPTDNVVIKPMIIGLPPKNAPKKTKEQLANEAANKISKKAEKDPTLWLLEHPEYMIGPTGTPVLKSSMESQAPAEYLTLEQKALKEDFIKEQNEDPLQRSLGSVTDNPQTIAAAERYANTELAAPLLEKNPRDKYATRAEWIESFNPQERAIIQGSNKSYKFNPNVWTTFSRALQTEGNRDSQWQRNLDLTQEEKNRPVTKMDRLGLLAPLAIPAYGAQRLLTGDYENLSDIGSGDTPKPYFGDSGTMRDYYEPTAQSIGNGLWQAALDPLNYINAGGGNLLGDARLFNLLDGPISKSINEFSALTPNFRAFDPKFQALRNMRGYGTGIGNGVLPGHDDIFRYLAEAERTSGVDRSYLMGLSEDDFLRHSVVGADVRDPSYHVSDDLLGRWQLEDARINNRVPLAPPPSEISIPFAYDNMLISGSTPSIADRVFGRISDRVGALSRVRTPAQARTFMRNTFGFGNSSAKNTPRGVVNKSLLGKNETKALLKDKSEIDKLEKLSEAEFKDILITPDGKIKFPEKYTGPKQITKIETKDWVDEFNGNLELLNRIIAENNTSGHEYWVTGISEDGLLSFRTDGGRTSTMRTYIKPGKFRGEVQDIADESYMVNEIPGLQMAGASPVFGNPIRGTGTYKSLNEYLKKLDLGRIKSGMNVQSNYSRPLWENAIKKGDAFGFYASPGLVYGIMKKEGGTKKKKPGFQVLTDANGKYVFVKT